MLSAIRTRLSDNESEAICDDIASTVIGDFNT